VRESENEGERERDTERQRERKRERARERVLGEFTLQANIDLGQDLASPMWLRQGEQNHLVAIWSKQAGGAVELSP
jgi:hypothetical protein